jgi:hypothetical protein
MQSVSGALKEQHTHYMAVREKLWFTKPKAVAPVEVVEPPPVVKVVYVRRPIWKRQEIDFDLHVLQYQSRMMNIACSPTMVYIQDRCRELGVSYADIIVHCRRREFVRPRQLIMWELRHNFNLSYPKIGSLFGKLDHTTVIWAVRRVDVLKARGEL